MPLRDAAWKKTLAAAAAPIILVLLFIWLGLRPSNSTSAPAVQQTFYTVDDGKTLFVAAGDLLPPFTHQGKPAVRAHVFSVDDGKTRWVGYLEQFTPEFKRELERASVPRRGMEFVSVMEKAMRSGGRQIKKPGDAEWVASSDAAKAARIRDVVPPPGMSGQPMPVLP